MLLNGESEDSITEYPKSYIQANIILMNNLGRRIWSYLITFIPTNTASFGRSLDGIFGSDGFIYSFVIFLSPTHFIDTS
jgi:hypothetical protein